MTTWRTHWASGTDRDPRLVLQLAVGAVTAVAWYAHSSRPLLAVCLRDDAGEPRFRLQVWDVLAGVRTELPCADWVPHLGLVTIAGEPVLVTAHDDGLRLWDVAEGRTFATVPIGGREVLELHLTELDGGVQAVIRDRQGHVHTWALPSGDYQGEPAGARRPRDVSSIVRATVDGRERVTVGDASNRFVTFDPATGEQLGVPLTAHVNRFGDVLMALGRDGSERRHSLAAVGGVLAVATAGRVHLWDSGTGRPHALPLTGPVARAILRTVRWQGREVLLTASGHDGVVALWDLDRAVTRPPGHDQRITRVALAGSAGTVVSVDIGGTLVTRDATDGRLLVPPLATGIQSTAALVAWPAAGAVFAATGAGTERCSDGHLRRWNVTTGEAAGPPVQAHLRCVRWLAQATLPTGEVLATSGPGAWLRLWDPATGALLSEVETGIRSKQTGLAVGDLSGRPHAAISSFSQPLSLYALDDLTAPPLLIPDAGNDHVLAVARDHVVTVSSDRRELRTWLAPGHRAGPVLPGAAEVTAVAVRDWPVLYIGRSDGTVALTDVLTGADLCPPLKLPIRPVSLAVLDGGDLVAGYGSDTARVSPPLH